MDRAKRKGSRPPPPSGTFDACDDGDLVSPIGEPAPTAPVKPPKAKVKAKGSKDPFADDPFANGEVPEPSESEVKSALPDVDPFASDHGSKSPLASKAKASKAKPKPESKGKKKAKAKDPFADDPFADGEVPEPSESEVTSALPDVDPFASDHGSKSPGVSKAKAKASKAKAPKAKPKSKAGKDPFADDPFAKGEVPEPSDSAVAKALAEANVTDPFASGKSSAAPPFEAEEEVEPAGETSKKKRSTKTPTKSKQAKTKDPFADDPFAGAEVPEPAEVVLEDDPFASKAGKGKPKPTKTSAKTSESKQSSRAPAPAISMEAGEDLVAPAGRKPKPKPQEGKDKPEGKDKAKSKAKQEKQEKQQKQAKKPAPPKILLPTPRALDQCAVCREQAGEDEVCPACGISLHPACLKQAKRCPSSECAGSKSFHEQLTLVMRRPRTLLVTGVCVGLIAIVAGGGVLLLNNHRDQQELDAFLQVAPTLPARQALFRGEKLRPSVQEREEVAALLTELRGRVEGEGSRKKALQALADAGSDPKASAEAVAKALKLDATCGPAYIRRAKLKLRQAMAEWPPDKPLKLSELVRPALVDLNEAIRHEPKAAAGFYGRAVLYMLLGKQTAAQTDLQRVLRLESDSDSPLRAMALGRQAQLHDDTLEALTQFDRALTSDQRSAEAQLARGWALFLLGKPAEALKQAKRSQTRDPKEVSVYLLAIEATRQLPEARREELLAYLDRALELFPACARALALRAAYRLEYDDGGRIRSGKADRELSRRDATRALAQDAAQVAARGVLAELHAFRGKARLAEQKATEALRAGDPRDQVPARVLRARLRIARRDSSDAVFADLNQVLKLDPEHVSALLLRGHAHLLRGRRKEARADLDRAIFVEPNLAEAHRLRGLVLLESDPPEVAPAILDFTHFIAARGRRPGVGNVYLLRARANYLATRYKAALSDLRSAKRLGAEVPTSLQLRVKGDAAYRARRWKQARGAYQKLLALPKLPAKDKAEAKRRLKDCDVVLNGKLRTF